MKSISLIRELRLKNLEAFRIRKDFYGETICYMIIADFARPSKLDDFPMLRGIEDEKDFGRSNFIQAIILHDHPIDDLYQDEIVSVAGGLLENKDDCHWNTIFVKVESQEFADMAESRRVMLGCFERILQDHGLNVQLTDIGEDRFNYLSQD
jgi:hypothetical protein